MREISSTGKLVSKYSTHSTTAGCELANQRQTLALSFLTAHAQTTKALADMHVHVHGGGDMWWTVFRVVEEIGRTSVVNFYHIITVHASTV